jgi:uncharacterized membrane protein YkvA (DUF1232 family)
MGTQDAKGKEEMNSARLSVSDRAKDINFLKDVINQLRLVYYLLRDADVPFYLKLLPFVSVIYVLWPLDLVPDLLPIFGQLDDLTALFLGAKLFVELSPREIVDYYLRELKSGVGGLDAGNLKGDEGKDEPVVILEDDVK